MKKALPLKLLSMMTLLAGALMASHFLIYKALIIPQLPFIKSVPLIWWLASLTPLIAVLTLFGSSLKSWRQLVVFSIGAGLVIQVFGFLMTNWNEPGYLKAYESAFIHWTVFLVIAIIEAAILFSVGILLAKIVSRKAVFA